MKILVIGDLHAHPDYDLKRCEVAGQYAAELQPDVIVSIGDWSDVCGLNTHGSKLELEGRRLREDVQVTQESLAAFMKPLYRRKRKLPRRVITLGNHENRFMRWLDENPRFEGLIGVSDLGFDKFGFEVVPYKRKINIAGFNFVHNLGSMTPSAARIDSPSNGVKAVGVSTVVGHTHVQKHILHPYEDRKIHGIDVGCFIHPDMGRLENWSCDTEYKYWRGLCVLENASQGDADVRWVRATTLGC